MIKIKLMIYEDLTRSLIELIYLKLLNNLNCSLYLFLYDIPNNLYKKIVFDKNTNVNLGLEDLQKTPLIEACNRGDKLKVKLLLSHPSIKVNLQDIFGNTALLYACVELNILIIKLLLLHPDIDVNTKDDDLFTALMYSCWYEKRTIIKLLLKHPKIDVMVKTKNDHTAIEYTDSLLIKELIKNHPTYKGN